jgi:hypothetical protein
MRKRWIALLSAFAATLALTIGAMGSASLISAQGTAATPDHSAMADMTGHPAHIHDGTCATLGGIAWPLNNVGGSEEGMASPEADMGTMSMSTPEAAESGEVEESTTTVDVSLDDILAAEHAINVHESVDNIQNYIACGDVTGTPTNGELEIELAELNGSGYSGTATLTDNGDGTTTVYVEVTHSGTGTPVASRAGYTACITVLPLEAHGT